MSPRKQLLLSELEEALGRKYKILRKIGSGGFGDVYLGEHAQLGRRVAIKILLEMYATQPDVVTRFQREARAAATLAHPNIIDILDVGDRDGLYFFVMRFVDGQTLAEKMEREKKMEPGDTIHIMKQVADALDYAHEHDVIHRDIKPSNIMLDEFGKPVLMDFGVARIQYEGNLTKTGTLMGTPHYLAPEQPLGKPVDGRSDIYSLGIMLYEMLAGEPPFHDENSVTLIFKHINEQPQPLQKVVPGLKPELCAVVHKMIEKLPENRYQTAGEVADALEALVGLYPPPVSGAFRKSSTPGAARNTEKLLLLAQEHMQQNKVDEAISIYAAIQQRKPEQETAKRQMEEITHHLTEQFRKSLSDEDFLQAQRILNQLQRLLPSDKYAELQAALEKQKNETEARPTVMGSLSSDPAAPQAQAMNFIPADSSPAPVAAEAPVPSAAPAPAAAAKDSTRPRTSLILVLPLVLAALLGGATLLYMWLKPNPAPVLPPAPAPVVKLQPAQTKPVSNPIPPPPPAPVTGKLTVTSQPEGAKVFLTGQEKGVTPLEIPDLAFGKYDVKVQLKGYEDMQQQVELSPQTSTSEPAFQLLPTTSTSGTLVIQSNPPEAVIFIGKRSFGVTPKTISEMGAGKYNVLLKKEGYEDFTAPVRVKEGQSIKIDAQLIPVAPVVPIVVAPVPPHPGELVEMGPDVTPPKAIKKITPHYSGKLWGTVRLGLLVSETGKVIDTRVLQSGGQQLDDAAIAATKQWTYEPAKKLGVPVKIWSDVTITFAKKS